MANRFGRNQRRQMRDKIAAADALADAALREAAHTRHELEEVLRDQLLKGVVPLEVEHFIDPRQRSIVMHAIFDERRTNLHYQHKIGPHEMADMRDRTERERFGKYLGRAIADRIADAYAGKTASTSHARRTETQP